MKIVLKNSKVDNGIEKQNRDTGWQDVGSIDKYFQEISKYNLLTRKEEVELFKKFHKWWRNKGKAGQKTRENGKAARERLITSNLRLVVKIAQKYAGIGMPLIDLIQEGNEGLILGVEKFKSRKGCKLSTYASFWIRQKVIRALNNKAHTIRLPVDAQQKHLNILKYMSAHKDEHGELPEQAEIMKKFKITKKRLENILEARTGMVSINCPAPNGKMGVGGERTFEDIIEDTRTTLPNEFAELANNKKIVTELINKLSNRERYILYNRFGLGNKDVQTLEEIGGKFGLTRERIRQIETIALRKLRKLVTTQYRINDGEKHSELMWRF